MCRQHGLGALQVSVAGDDQPVMPLSIGYQRALEPHEAQVDSIERLANPEFDIRGDLVIAAPAHVQLPPNVPQLLDQCRFNVHVHIFPLQNKRKFASFDTSLNFRQTQHNSLAFIVREETDPREHSYVRDRTLDVVPEEAAVKGDRFRKPFDTAIRMGTEAATPRLLSHLRFSVSP
jgi:hypothetical protein